MRTLNFLSFILFIVFQSCTNSAPKQDTLNAPDGKVKTDTLNTVDVLQVNLADESFAADAAINSMIEIQMGEIMTSKAYLNEIKKFATQIVQAHKIAISKLQQIADKQNITLPSAIGKALQDQVDSLSFSGGREIDHKYLTFMIKAQGQALKKFEDASKTLQNEALNVFTLQMIPVIKMQLEKAKKLQIPLKNNN